MSHPYSSLSNYNFWYKSVAHPLPGLVDPVTSNFVINQTDKVATMGSCFAQHLSKCISKAGFYYYVAETAPYGMTPSDAHMNNYGTFSARYGNVYTARQALQLFDRAYGLFNPEPHIWKRDSVYVDAFRPHTQPNGYTTAELLLADRASHLSAVRDVFEKSNILIFTLGLTESWQSKADGSIFPIAPGVFGGTYNANEHQFVNFNVVDVIRDMNSFIKKIREVNPNIKIILTVSPVPLVATYEDRHVLVSTCYSKSVLRVAAAEVERSNKDVVYFPSYEIITSPSSEGRYYADDLRQVTSVGVGHVMRVFSKHFMPQHCNDTQKKSTSLDIFQSDTEDCVICDEELVIKAIKESGF